MRFLSLIVIAFCVPAFAADLGATEDEFKMCLKLFEKVKSVANGDDLSAESAGQP